jgi:ribosome-associated protein
MELRKLQKIVIAALEDVKGKEIEVLNTGHLTPLFERIVIACGDSNRQVRALAQNVADKVREAGGEILSIEGEEGGEWVLVDLGDMVVHVMQPETRRYYNLEELWRDAVPSGTIAPPLSAARPSIRRPRSGEK